SLFGTEGSYEEQNEMKFWNTVHGHTEDVTEKLLVDGFDRMLEDDDGLPTGTSVRDNHSGLASVHDASRLPESYAGLRNGHEGSHAFLVDDFVRACTSGKLPPQHVWDAARWNLPGIIAHESARREGERLDIPDLGDPPAGASLLWP
ncbi:MAG TPA: hypothetical protein VNT60_11520, partial [Deinococcales bacterium]|nr:hypothetical protein [Deinococcales bacterium]